MMRVACVLFILINAACAGRHLVFATNTTMGLEIAFDGSSTTPARFVIGYKRQEGTIFPVGVKNTAADAKTDVTLREEGYSVLAKVRGKIQGQAGNAAQGGIEAAQWFATGKAAILLAKQPGIAGAVIGSEKATVAGVEAGLTALTSLPDAVTVQLLETLKRVIEAVAGGSASPDQADAQRLNDELVNVAFDKMRYDFSRLDDRNKDLVPMAPSAPLLGTTNWDRLLEYLGTLDIQIQRLDGVVAAGGTGYTLAGAPIDLDQVRAARDTLVDARSTLLDSLAKDEAIRAAKAFVRDRVLR